MRAERKIMETTDKPDTSAQTPALPETQTPPPHILQDIPVYKQKEIRRVSTAVMKFFYRKKRREHREQLTPLSVRRRCAPGQLHR
jgi:hypothetical protein